MKLKKLGAFAATGAMALALALTGCGSSNATSGSDAGSSSSDDAKVEKVDGSKEYALVKDGTLTVGTSAEYAPFEYKDETAIIRALTLSSSRLSATSWVWMSSTSTMTSTRSSPVSLRALSTTSPSRLSPTRPSVRRKSLSLIPITWTIRLS